MTLADDGLPCNACTSRAAYGILQDATGAQHNLIFDTSNYSLLRSIDGSGWIAQLAYPASTTPPSQSTFSETYLGYSYLGNFGATTVTSESGIQYFFPAITSPYIYPSIGSIKDPSGNQILVSNAPNQLQDSGGRTINAPSAPSTDISHCPSVDSNHPATQSQTWSVPGPDQGLGMGNQNVTYLLCYTPITIDTNFFGNGGADYEYLINNDGDPYYIQEWEVHDIQNLLQSVTLPDGTHWGFQYDGTTPSHPLPSANYPNPP